MAPGGEALRVEVRLALKLRDALSDLVRMRLLIVGVLEELACDGLGMNAAGHEVMTLVTQNAYDLGSKHFIQDGDHLCAIRLIAVGDRALLEVLARPLPDLFDIR